MNDDTNLFDIYETRLRAMTQERDRLQLENDTLRIQNDSLQMMLRQSEFRCGQQSRGSF